MGVRQNFIGPHVCDIGRTLCRMLNKARLLTRPTLARRDAPCPKQGRSKLSLHKGWPGPQLRATFSPAHPLTRRDVPFARARAFLSSSLRAQGSSQTVLHCVHRTSTVLSCAFCEHKGWSGCSPFCSSEAARCASTGIVPAIPPPFSASC